jgi:hypothetical protein
MEHLVKLLRDSYDLQEKRSEETAYWHLQKLRSEIKQLTLTDVVFSEAELNAKLQQQKEDIKQWLIGEDYEMLAESI